MKAIIAALPREVAGLVRRVKAEAGPKRVGVHIYRLPGVVVVCAGMGAARANLALQAALEGGEVTLVVSAGLAGACDAGAAVGSVVEAGTVVDAGTGERYGTGYGTAVLVTTHAVAGVKEKARLRAAYGAAVVDMEAATVARMAGARGIAFRAIKAVSDAHDFEMTSLGRFASAHGHFRTGAFALHTALRPVSWRHAVRLGRGSQRALAALTDSLEGI